MHVPSCKKGGQNTAAVEEDPTQVLAPAKGPAQGKSSPRARKTPPWRTSAPKRDGKVQRDEKKQQDAVDVPVQKKVRFLKKTKPPSLLRTKLQLRRQICSTTCYCELVKPFRMRCMRTPAKLQPRYILDGSKKHVGECAITMSPKFEEIMHAVLGFLNDGTLTCKLQVHQTIIDMVQKAKGGA